MNAREFRLKPGALCAADGMPFQQHYEAKVIGVDLNDPEILSDALFANVQDNLRVGDEVVVCNYLDNSRDRLTQFVRLRIVAKGTGRVTFVKDGEVVSIPLTDDEPKPKPDPMKLIVRRGAGSTWGVFDRDDNLIENFKNKKEADAWAQNAHLR